ncbi:MAG: hypothetical protein AAGJ93_01025 [Bacteroidota bacterium]
MLSFIIALFVLRYSARITSFNEILAVLSFAFMYAHISGKFTMRFSLPEKYLKALVGFLGVVILGCAILANLFISLESLNVDRWSVIASFITALEGNTYPYFAESHMGNPPGPMPFYFVVAYPFFKLGGLSFLSALGYLGLLRIVTHRNDHKTTLVALTTILLFPFMYWEIATRSNIMTFSMLSILVVHFFDRIDFQKSVGLTFVITAVCAGLILSTRSIFIIPYLVFGYLAFLESYRKKEIPALKNIVLFGGLLSVVFLATFFPLYLVWPQEFWQTNPFSIQSGVLMPSVYIYVSIGVLLLSLSVLRNVSKADKFFLSGVGLFSIILVYTIFQISTDGLYNIIYNSSMDISYYLFCVPYLLYYLSSEHTLTPLYN